MNPTVNTADQIRIFAEYERARYESFVAFIQWFLNEVRQRVAPMGTVAAQPKEVASFAEKILRKPKYNDPVHQFADLCGGRLIVHTRREMVAADRLISQCLKIVAREDKLEVSGVNQFGYGSVHLDVAIGADLEKNLIKAGMVMPDEIKRAVKGTRERRHDGKPIERKAEIQVRTDLQHVWADTLHDLLYKGGIDIPKPLQREANRLSAVLEEASTAIDDLVLKLEAYKVDHGAFLSIEQINEERGRLYTLLKQKLSDKALGGIALRLAKLSRSLRDWPGVIALEPWIKQCGTAVRNELRFAVAEALCKHNGKKPSSAAFRKGLGELRAIAQPVELSGSVRNTDQKLQEISAALCGSHGDCGDNTLRSRTMAELARAVFVAKQDSHYTDDARDLYFQAHLLEPEDPYVYARYLHSHAVASGNKSFAVFMRTEIDRMIAVCREHAHAGIELPFAHFAQGMLYVLIGDIDSSLLCCTRGIASSNDIHQIEEEIGLFRELRDALVRNDVAFAVKLEMVLQTLALGVIARPDTPETSSLTANSLLTCVDQKPLLSPIIIIAGTCDPAMNSDLEKYRPAMDHAIGNFTGTIYCGGTNAGISAIVGDAVAKARAKGVKIALKAYRPGTLKEDFSAKHPAYEQIQMENAVGFTSLQAIQYWSDLLQNSVKPGLVRVMGVGGGKISLFEYHLAMALGATVGIIEGSGRSGADIVGEESWWSKAKKGRCFTLPNDRETIWNFMNVIPGDLGLDESTLKRIEPAARGLHAQYVANALGSSENKNLRPWDTLPLDLRTSSLHQALHLSRLLAGYGLEIRELGAKPGKPVLDLEKELGADGIERLAEIEHGRWNVERLFQGWKYGEVKNIDLRTSPYLKPWKDVPENIKKYDREPFKKLPGILKEVGLGVFKAM